MRVCSCGGCAEHDGSCPELVSQGRCDICRPAYERARGTRQQRGYGPEHDRLRARWEPYVERGEVDCQAVVCLMSARRILTGQAWDLGHDRVTGRHRGPEHERCNRSEGGKAAHGGRA